MCEQSPKHAIDVRSGGGRHGSVGSVGGGVGWMMRIGGRAIERAHDRH